MPRESFMPIRSGPSLKTGSRYWLPILTRRGSCWAVKFSKEYEEDRVLREVAQDMGRGDTYSRVDYVGVYTWRYPKPKDPYFKDWVRCAQAAQSAQVAWSAAGMVPRIHWTKNYLWFAENMFGARVLAETRVTKIENTEDEYRIHTEQSTSWFGKKSTTYRARGLVARGGVLGTLDLLLRQKHVDKTLIRLSDKLGEHPYEF